MKTRKVFSKIFGFHPRQRIRIIYPGTDYHHRTGFVTAVVSHSLYYVVLDSPVYRTAEGYTMAIHCRYFYEDNLEAWE